MKGVLGAFAEDRRRRAGEEKEEELPLRAWLDLAEAWRIHRALEQSGGNRSAAARALGIGRRTLYSKLDKLRYTSVFGDSVDFRRRRGISCSQ